MFWFYDARWARRIRDLASNVGRFDAIHVHDLPLVRTAQRVAKRMGAVVVADLHENYPMVLPFYATGKSLSPIGRFLVAPRRWERYEKRSVPTCSAVIAVTDEMRSRLMAIGVPADRIAVVENLVDSGRFLTYPLDAAPLSRAAGSLRSRLTSEGSTPSAVSTPPSEPCQPSSVPCPRPS